MKVEPGVETRVKSYIIRHRLVADGDLVLVAVSGGADSVCLLHMLLGLQEKLGIRLHVAHLNHQLRGAESDADAAYVAELAERLGLPATIGRVDVKACQESSRLSLEEAARDARYQFLAEAAGQVGAAAIATGHTGDDNVETILMHIIRGSGTRGLMGLAPRKQRIIGNTNVSIIRPLLDVSRRETGSYCQNQGLLTRLDSSNLSLSPLRNRVRQELLPLLAGYNPAFGDALLRLSAVARDELALLEEVTAQLKAELVTRQGEVFIIDRAEMLNLKPALRRKLLRSVFKELPGGLKDIEARHIEEIMSTLEKPAGKRLSLPHGLTFATDYDRYLIGEDIGSLSPYPAWSGEYRLNVPGETVLPSWKVSVSLVESATEPEDGFAALLDYDRVGDQLSVRNRRPGDVFQPPGMGRPKKLKDFMIDTKIPRGYRTDIPLVCAPSGIVWVVGYRIAETARTTPQTRQMLRIEFQAPTAP